MKIDQNKSGDGSSSFTHEKVSSLSPHDAKGYCSGSFLECLFINQMNEIYCAEKHVQEALPELVDAATTAELKEVFEDHLHQTSRQIKRLERVFEMVQKKAEGEKCEAMQGILKECTKVINESTEGTMMRDAALIIMAKKIEHYEIATYIGLLQLAVTNGLHEAVELLDKNLREEENTDCLLTELAETSIHIDADSESNLL